MAAAHRGGRGTRFLARTGRPSRLTPAGAPLPPARWTEGCSPAAASPGLGGVAAVAVGGCAMSIHRGRPRGPSVRDGGSARPPRLRIRCFAQTVPTSGAGTPTSTDAQPSVLRGGQSRAACGHGPTQRHRRSFLLPTAAPPTAGRHPSIPPAARASAPDPALVVGDGVALCPHGLPVLPRGWPGAGGMAVAAPARPLGAARFSPAGPAMAGRAPGGGPRGGARPVRSRSGCRRRCLRRPSRRPWRPGGGPWRSAHDLRTRGPRGPPRRLGAPRLRARDREPQVSALPRGHLPALGLATRPGLPQPDAPAAAGPGSLAAGLGAGQPSGQDCSASLARSCMTALVCIWQIRLSVTPRTLPISASVRPS